MQVYSHIQITVFLKTVSLKPFLDFLLTYEVNFSRLVCFSWVRKKVFTSFIFEKNVWIHDKLDILTHNHTKVNSIQKVLWQQVQHLYVLRMHTIIIFKENNRSNNSKVQGNVFILKTMQEQLRYLEAFRYKAIKCSKLRMRKITKQIFKGHVTHALLILMSFFSHFLLKLQFLCLFFLLFSETLTSLPMFTFWYSIQYLGNIN